MLKPKIVGLDTGVEFEFDCTFCQEPYEPDPRIKLIETNKAVFREKTLPVIRHGMDYVEWEFFVTCNLYNRLDSIYRESLESCEYFTFTGRLNEEYVVEFSKLDGKQYGPYWKVKGRFRVVCVNRRRNPCQTCDPDFEIE